VVILASKMRFNILSTFDDPRSVNVQDANRAAGSDKWPTDAADDGDTAAAGRFTCRSSDRIKHAAR